MNGGRRDFNLRLHIVIVIQTTGHSHRGKKGTPPLNEEIPYQITLIRLSQVSLDRRRREKVIWEMITEHNCNTFADLECESCELRKVVIDEVAQDVSWERKGGTKRLVRLAMSLIRA